MPTSQTGKPLAFYTVANAAFFPGAVALLNSLRAVGEDAPLIVVDCGLTEAQRARLAPVATIVPMHAQLHPQLQKATGPLTEPADVMVVIDADIIVNRPLTPLLVDLRDGRIVVFEDDFFRERRFPEWSSLGLGEPRPTRYVNSGFLAFSRDVTQEFLPLFVELQKRIDPSQMSFGGGTHSDPYYFCDQDVLNAMFATRFHDVVAPRSYELVALPPFSDLEPTPGNVPLCRFEDGRDAPYILHHILAKPWLAKTPWSVYAELFRHLTTRSGPLFLANNEVPPRLGSRPLAPLDRRRVSLQLELHARLRGKLGIRPILERRLQAARRRLVSGA